MAYTIRIGDAVVECDTAEEVLALVGQEPLTEEKLQRSRERETPKSKETSEVDDARRRSGSATQEHWDRAREHAEAEGISITQARKEVSLMDRGKSLTELRQLREEKD